MTGPLGDGPEFTKGRCKNRVTDGKGKGERTGSAAGTPCRVREYPWPSTWRVAPPDVLQGQTAQPRALGQEGVALTPAGASFPAILGGR